jgi:hypothetical protein
MLEGWAYGGEFNDWGMGHEGKSIQNLSWDT